MFDAPRPLALALVLPLAGLGAAAELGPPALTGADYARARSAASDLVSLSGEIEGRIRAAVAEHFEESQIDVELLGIDEVKVLLKVRTKEMAYPEVQRSLQLLARTINEEVLGKYYRNMRLSPSSALVVMNRREGSMPAAPEVREAVPEAAPEAPPMVASAAPTGPAEAPGTSSAVARAATSPALRAGGRLADLARRLRARAAQHQAPPRPMPGDPGPRPASGGQVLPGSAGVVFPTPAPEPTQLAAAPPAAPIPPEPLVLEGPEGLGTIPAARAPRQSLLDELARIDEPGLPVSPKPRRPRPRIEGEGMTFLLGEHLASLGAPRKVTPPKPQVAEAAQAVAPPVAALLAELSEVDTAAEAEGFSMNRPLPLPKAGPPPTDRHLHASVPVRFRPAPRPRPRKLLPRRPPPPKPRKPRVHPVIARRRELEQDIFTRASNQPPWEADLPPVESVPVPRPPPGPPVINPPPPPFTAASPQVRPPPRPPLKPEEAQRVVRPAPTWGGGTDLAPEELDELAGFSTDEAGFYLQDSEQEAFDEAVSEAWIDEAF